MKEKEEVEAIENKQIAISLLSPSMGFSLMIWFLCFN